MVTRLLGGMIRHPATVLAVLRFMRPEDSSSESDRVVFSALVALSRSQSKIDLVSLAEVLHGSRQVPQAGGYARLADLWLAACPEDQVLPLAQQLVARARHRGGHMDQRTSIAEVDANRHPVLLQSEQYEVVRCVYDFDHERGDNTVTLTMVHRQTGDRRCLRFSGVSCCVHPLSGCVGIYIRDTKYRQWEQCAGVEVGEFFEGGGVYFLAESVEEAHVK